MPAAIPLADLRREYSRYHSEIDAAIARVLRRGWFVLGEEGTAFEAEWAAYCGAGQAVGVSSGTDAIHLALRAAGIGPADEVIVPALTSTYTALGVSLAGARPVFADVDPGRYTLDPAAFEAAITPYTAAVIPVHLYGCPADMPALLDIARRHSLLVLEDAAQAHGARIHGRRAGALGDVAAFSFYPSTNLGAYGDGGAVVTSDAALADKVRMLRHGGQRQPYEHELVGVNSRLDELQAAILRAKLPHLDRWNEHRRALAARYRDGLRGCQGLSLPPDPPDAEPVYHLYVVRVSEREPLREYLGGAGVTTLIQYPKPVPLQAAYAALGHTPGAFPNAETIAAQAVSLPIFAQLDTGEVDQVVRLIRIFFAVR